MECQQLEWMEMIYLLFMLLANMQEHWSLRRRDQCWLKQYHIELVIIQQVISLKDIEMRKKCLNGKNYWVSSPVQSRDLKSICWEEDWLKKVNSKRLEMLLSLLWEMLLKLLMNRESHLLKNCLEMSMMNYLKFS